MTKHCSRLYFTLKIFHTTWQATHILSTKYKNTSVQLKYFLNWLQVIIKLNLLHFLLNPMEGNTQFVNMQHETSHTSDPLSAAPYKTRVILVQIEFRKSSYSICPSQRCQLQTLSRPAALFRPGCLLTCNVFEDEYLIKVAQVSWELALAAAVARICMILSRVGSLKKQYNK